MLRRSPFVLSGALLATILFLSMPLSGEAVAKAEAGAENTGAVVEPAVSDQPQSSAEQRATTGHEPEVGVWLKNRFPRSLHRVRVVLPDYQWICLLALIFIGFLADAAVRSALHYVTHAWLKYVRSDTEARIERKLWRPVGLLAQALVWYGGTTLIGLPDFALTMLLAGLKLFAVVAAVWTAFMLINLLAVYLARRAATTETKFDDLLVPLISSSLKVFVVVLGVLMCAEAFNLPITGLLGGTAIAGAALAFASKDAVSNLFGSLTVLVDRPFEIGDWIITPGAEGSVEAVGFRSTRIRTFYNSLITVPNCLLTTAVVDNMGRRRYRRIKTLISLQYDTAPEKIDAFCEGVRELIRRHGYTRKDYYHVYLNGLSDSSLDVLLYCFLECPDWAIELREKHRLYIDILRLAKRLGVEFAFPTRTLHLFQETHGENGPVVDLSEPLQVGRRTAAAIAGPPVPPEKRPGPVEFPGPSPCGSDEADHDDA